MPTTMTEVKGRLIFNSTLTRDYLCAECFGGLVERRMDGDYHVICAQDPGHREYIHQAEARKLQAENQVMLDWWTTIKEDSIPILQPLGLEDFQGFD
jgi:hypothetical protein